MKRLQVEDVMMKTCQIHEETVYDVLQEKAQHLIKDICLYILLKDMA